MPVNNSDVARIFNKVADLLEIKEANPFRVRSYRNAARTVQTLSRQVRDLVEEGEDLTELSGIGEDLAGKIREIVETGKLQMLSELEQEVPSELAGLMRIEGLGPKKVYALWQELGITTAEELEKAARNHEIQEIKGFGEKTEHKILDHIEQADREEQRTLLWEAEEVAEPLVEYMASENHVTRVQVAGSYRRRRETVGDLDILVISDEGEMVADHFVNYEDVDEVVSKGETRSTVILRSGLQVDVRVIAEESYGAALMYFTGSKSHNIALRNIAVDRDYKINEYGVFDADGEMVTGETEDEIYRMFDCEYVPPELRENRGEIEAAQLGELPELIAPEDLRGDLQSHTVASDGNNSLEEMAEAARKLGHEYLAITDHSEHIGITTGLDEERLSDQMDEIDELNRRYDDFRILKSCEVDLEKDGSLALNEATLEKLDLVLIAVHSHFDLPEEEQTKRVIQGLGHDCVHVLAHPTTRLIGQRDPIELDLEAVMDAAQENDCYLEINAQPQRLDINDVQAKMAKEKGLKLTISTDAHHAQNLDFLPYGVHQARRGWIEPDDVLNTRPWKELKTFLK